MASGDVTAALRDRVAGRTVTWGLVCGSGLGRGLVGSNGLGLTNTVELPLGELGLPTPGVDGHGQAIVHGYVGSAGVLVQTGRLHPYEGHDAATCTRGLAAMIEAGARKIVLTCAVGSVRPALAPGQLVALTDQLNLFGPTPLAGPQFVDCGQLYDVDLRDRLRAAAASVGASLAEGIYAYGHGPQYETPAEAEALRRLGADVVGMSTTYEAILAASLGATVCGVALVTNTAGVAGLSHDEVTQRSDEARVGLASLLRKLFDS